MKRKAYLITALLFVTITLCSFRKNQAEIKGWYLTGGNPENYEIGVQTSTERGSKVAYLKSVKTGKGFGTLMQYFTPEEYSGKRIRLSAFIKTSDVNDWAGMWIRVDGDDKKVLAFNNMQNNPIEGTTNWKKYEVVIDVAEKNKGIGYGVLLSGQGQVWIDDINFEIVDKNVPLTPFGPLKKKGSSNIPNNKPFNTNFEEAE